IMSSFFIKKKGPPKVFKKNENSAGSKRKNDTDTGNKLKKKRNSKHNEEISSDSETEGLSLHRKRRANVEEEFETPQEKKLRLAKLYLDQLRDEEEKKAEEESFEMDLIALLPPDVSEIRLLRGHKLPVTCLIISPDEQYVFSASKDCSIIKYMNKLIMIWEAATCKHLYKFTGHKGPVSGLSFRRGTHDLYSATHDRSIKVWNVDENAYVETLFGHQDVITGLDSGSRERCVTAGGRDRTVRVWKIAEESQLVFHGHEGSIDCIQLINEEHMITGANDGSVSLWSVNKKKPLSVVKAAHGRHGDSGLEQPYWVAAVAALLVTAGSHNSKVQLWKCGQGFSHLEPLFSVPVIGFVNSLKFSSSGKFLVAGVGQEHRLGRWWRLKEAKNGLYIIPLKRRQEEVNGE
uniref:U3 small nucleolar RNA-interacting protein 2 n=1 Tax=Oncorhynchus tshawytscha TaxID=74940 RepID=A0A8C8J617_ONCTS